MGRKKLTEFQELRRETERIRKLERTERRRLRNWGVGQTEHRRTRRERYLPKDRICPECGRGPLLKWKQWVVVVVVKRFEDDRVVSDRRVRCKSCDMKNACFQKAGEFLVQVKDIVTARRAAGMSQREMAKRCGWSNVWQSKLEKKDSFLFTGAQVWAIKELFNEIGIHTC